MDESRPKLPGLLWLAYDTVQDRIDSPSATPYSTDYSSLNLRRDDSSFVCVTLTKLVRMICFGHCVRYKILYRIYGQIFISLYLWVLLEATHYNERILTSLVTSHD